MNRSNLSTIILLVIQGEEDIVPNPPSVIWQIFANSVNNGAAIWGLSMISKFELNPTYLQLFSIIAVFYTMVKNLYKNTIGCVLIVCKAICGPNSYCRACIPVVAFYKGHI